MVSIAIQKGEGEGWNNLLGRCHNGIPFILLDEGNMSVTVSYRENAHKTDQVNVRDGNLLLASEAKNKTMYLWVESISILEQRMR